MPFSQLTHKFHNYIAVENTEKKFIPEEVMTEEIESELLLYHPPLPVAKQSKGEIAVM